MHDDALGVSFFDQSTPELVAWWRVRVGQLAVDRRQQVVDHHRRPDAETPKPELENSRVARAEFLFTDDYLQQSAQPLSTQYAK